MDKEKIRKALDHFENDEYVESKEILQQEIQTKVNSHFEDKLDLQGKLNPPVEKEEDKTDDEG
jgi:hypothetical protein